MKSVHWWHPAFLNTERGGLPLLCSRAMLCFFMIWYASCEIGSKFGSVELRCHRGFRLELLWPLEIFSMVELQYISDFSQVPFDHVDRLRYFEDVASQTPIFWHQAPWIFVVCSQVRAPRHQNGLVYSLIPVTWQQAQLYLIFACAKTAGAGGEKYGKGVLQLVHEVETCYIMVRLLESSLVHSPVWTCWTVSVPIK